MCSSTEKISKQKFDDVKKMITMPTRPIGFLLRGRKLVKIFFLCVGGGKGFVSLGS